MILIVSAMESESKDFIKEAKKIDAPFNLYQKGNNLVLVSGIGKANAASSLSYVLAKYNIKLIINIGLAGGTKPYKLGDVVLIDKAKYHDFDLSIFNYEKGQVPGFDPIFKADSLIDKLYFQRGTLLTGDFFKTGSENLNHTLFDMEGAALFQVAKIYNIPIISIKVVSDIVGEDSQVEKYEISEAALSKTINEILIEIVGEL